MKTIKKYMKNFCCIIVYCTIFSAFMGCGLPSGQVPDKNITVSSKKDLSILQENNYIEKDNTTNQSIDEINPKTVEELVRINDIDETIVIDLKYATEDNFTGKVVYSFNTCLLRKETAQKLSNANKQLSSYNYRLKVYDGYRPPFAQEIFWELVGDERFVANPNKGGSVHSKGGAVDVTIVDQNGNELEMPSKFDDFSEKALRNNQEMSHIAKKNLDLLTSVMRENGFNSIETEWWHYNDKDSAKYGLVDVDPSIFE